MARYTCALPRSGLVSGPDLHFTKRPFTGPGTLALPAETRNPFFDIEGALESSRCASNSFRKEGGFVIRIILTLLR